MINWLVPEVVRRYWYTLRYLKPIQIYRRLWFQIQRPTPVLIDAPIVARWAGWQRPVMGNPSMSGTLTFEFLSVSGNLDEIGWNGSERAKLWRYNQHYFGDLNALGAGQRVGWHRGLISRWIMENFPGKRTGWEPYPTSLRIVNWIKWDLRLQEGGQAGLCNEQIESLATQVRWLVKRIEWHLLGNHLFANAKALVYGGCFFEGSEADEWFSQGASIVMRELKEQILPDGGHFELSPMYHSLVLEDVLDLVNVLKSFERHRIGSELDTIRVDLLGRLENAATRMISWLECLSHPDGEISFFNDAAFGVAPTNAELIYYAARLSIKVGEERNVTFRYLENSGYVRIADDHVCTLIDVGHIGPDYNPGHAHADTLSFEVSVFGQRVIVNSGTSVYEPGEARQYERGTAAHNTVAINGENSSEVWSSFRVARRARPFGLELEVGQRTRIVCSHDGYCRLNGKPVHQRTWTYSSRNLEISDYLSCDVPEARAYFHFHPAITLIAETDGVRLLLSSGDEVFVGVLVGHFQVVPDTWHPRFGESIETSMMVVLLDSNTSKISISW